MKFVNVRLLVGDIRAAIRFWRDVMGFRMMPTLKRIALE